MLLNYALKLHFFLVIARSWICLALLILKLLANDIPKMRRMLVDNRAQGKAFSREKR
jgi:hypothetical protein